ncbi:MAG TPA: energy transducer TonB [Terriglobales bacterium]|nr:energy transducer TonB [Terriglobales bacterium]
MPPINSRLFLAIAVTICVPTSVFAQKPVSSTDAEPTHCSINKHAKPPITAAYPESLKGSGIKGVVRLHVIVGTDGCPRQVTVAKKLHPQLDKLAKQAVETWKFEPAMKGGKPVTVLISLDVEFEEK